MEYKIREMKKSEYPLLNDFLYEAIFIPEGADALPKSVINHPELQVYIADFGNQKHDKALVAEINDKVVGAVWVRIMNDYGHIDDRTPSFAISLCKEYRGFGIGTAMMKEMLSVLKANGYEQASLSVQKANYAAKMYQKIGFEICDENEAEYIMVYRLQEYKILRIQEHGELMEQAAVWFHQKWGIPLSAYVESMEVCLENCSAVPQWYVVMKEQKIIAGLGVIENDFHDRKDLTPNVCAVYVEEKYRNRGIAGKMLQFVCNEFKEKGIDTLYLLTDHTSFYERYGWEFFCMAQGDGEEDMARMYIHKC